MKKGLSISKKGFSAVEVLLALTLISILALGSLGTLIYGTETLASADDFSRAYYLADEGLEIVKNIRDNDYSNISSGTYSLNLNSGNWELVNGTETIDEFSREITIGQLDPTTFQVTSNISWTNSLGNPQSVDMVTYLKDVNREIIIGVGWSLPTLQSSIDLTANNNARNLDKEGNFVFMVRQGNTDFVIFDVSDLNNPVQLSTLNLDSVPRDIKVEGNYAYVASQSNSEELQIIDISDPLNPVQVSDLNLPGNQNAFSIWVEGNYAYIGRSGGNEFVIVDISDPLNPVIESQTNSNRIWDLQKFGNYVYTVTTGTELQIFDVLNPSAPIQVVNQDLAGGADAESIFIDEINNRAFIGRNNGTVYILDISNPLSPSQISIYSDSGDVEDIWVDGDLMFLAYSATSDDLVIVDISDINNPVFEAATASYNTIFGIHYDASIDRLFAASADNTDEFIIFQPD